MITIPAPIPNPALAFVIPLGQQEEPERIELEPPIEQQVATFIAPPIMDQMQMEYLAIEPVEEEKIVRVVLNCKTHDDCGLGNLCMSPDLSSSILSISKNSVPLVSENPFLSPIILNGWQGKPPSKILCLGIKVEIVDTIIEN